MFGKVIFICALALAHSQPHRHVEKDPRLWEPSELCPPIHEHHLLPHENDCTKYYYCEYDMKYILPRDCSPGTEFSYAEQVCIHPALANCNLPGPGVTDPPPGPVTNPPPGPCPTCPPGSSSSVEPSSTTTTSTTSTSTTSTTTTTAFPPGFTLPNGCPANWNEEQLFPHSTRCDRFYQCTHGELVEMPCAPGTHFSFEKQECDWPHLVGCELDPGCNGNCPPGGSSTETVCTENGGIGCPGTLPNGCPADWSIHYLMPHADCDKFLQCSHWNVFEMPCAPGTIFSYAEQVCVHPWQCTDCGDCNMPAPSPSPSPGPTDPPPGPCPTCPPVTPEPPVTTVAPPCPTCPPVVTDPPPAPVTTPEPAPVTTPEPTQPPPAPCPTCPPVGTDPPVSPTVGPTSPPATVPTSQAPTTEAPCDCEDGGTDCEVDYDAICRDGCHVLPWAHATDCDKFWRCEGDKAIRVICAEGLHFNPSTATCDFQCNAGCVRRHTTTTTYADGLKIFVPFSEIGKEDGVHAIETRVHKAIDYAKKH